MISHYDWAGGREAMLRFGPADGPVVVMALALFEEYNRTRAFGLTILRLLAARGIAGFLPDLPGMGESLTALEATSLADWRAAFRTAAETAGNGRPVHSITIRGGALVDSETEVASRWQLSPVAGEGMVRELLRARAIAEPGTPAPFDVMAPDPHGPPVELAGNSISRAMLTDLLPAQSLTGSRIRVVRLRRDRSLSDRRIEYPPPWRRAEPDSDGELAVELAADIAEWIATCAG